MQLPIPLQTYLLQFREACPDWLARFQPGDAFNREAFFQSRVAYYPGHGTDGHAIKVFGSAHSAHCFVYVDYYVEKARIEEVISNPRAKERLRGYHSLARLHLSPADLAPKGWRPHVEAPNASSFGRNMKPFAFLDVLERDDGFDEAYGPKRIAVLFLGADGIATYDALFCQQNGVPPPFAVLLHDHGFGGNYDKFGQNGLLERIATECQVLPRFLLVATNTQPWRGYVPVPEVEGDPGGMYMKMRFLHERQGH